MVPTTGGAKRVGILGSGDVGQSLGRGLVRHGYEVKIGSRTAANPKLKPWVEETKGKGSSGTFSEAAQFGTLLIIATHGQATEDVVDMAGANNFDGKIVLDATNALDFTKGMPPGLFTGANDSLGERIQKKLPKAKVVKCFNTISHVQMVDPKFEQGAPHMMIAGDDTPAKKQVDQLLKTLGWPGALDVGDIRGARYLEALVPLWVRVGAKLNTWGHGFKVVT